MPFSSSFRTAVVRAAARTTTGTQDFTVSGFGTPKAAIFICHGAAVVDTEIAGIQGGYGLTDGTRQTLNVFASEDAVATSSVRTGATDGSCAGVSNLAASTFMCNAAFSAWITDGIRINWTTASGTAVQVTCVLLGGDDLTAYVSNVAASTLDTAVDVTAPGFQPELVIVAYSYGVTPSLSEFQTATNAHCIGIIHNGGSLKQYCVEGAAVGAQATMATGAVVMNNYGGAHGTKSATKRYYEFSSFDANGFTVTPRTATGYSYLSYMALKFNSNTNIYLEVIDSKTSNGDQAYTNPGFTPNFLMLLTSFCSSANTYAANADIGISVVDQDKTEFCHTEDDRDAIADSDTRTLVSNSIKQYNGTSQAIVATCASFDASGYTINYSTTDGTARKIVSLALSAKSTATAMAIFHHHMVQQHQE